MKKKEASIYVFPQPWDGKIPQPMSREEIKKSMESFFLLRKYSKEQIEATLDHLEEDEKIFFEGDDGKKYHRDCNGGAVMFVASITGPLCSRCGKLHPIKQAPPGFIPKMMESKTL